MKKSSTIVLKLVLVAIGISALAFMIFEPLTEGRNVGATLSEVYLNDPFLACVYIVSIAFFFALYQAFKILGYISQNQTFSQRTVKALRTIKYCMITLVSCVVGGEAYLFIVRPGDDIAGGVFIGLLMIFIFGVSAVASTVLEKLVQNALDIKSENDLTV